MEFETAVAHLSAGPAGSLFEILPEHAHGGTIRSTQFHDAAGKSAEASFFRYKRYWYCVYIHPRTLSEDERKQLCKAAGDAATPSQLARINSKNYWDRVEVYRLAPAPRHYSARTQRGKSALLRSSDNRLDEPTSFEQYQTDFLELISGREHSKLDIDYELIHSSMP